MLPLTTLRAQDWFLEGGVLQPLLSLASDADDTCRCASAVVAHTMRRLRFPGLSGGLRGVQASAQHGLHLSWGMRGCCSPPAPFEGSLHC